MISAAPRNLARRSVYPLGKPAMRFLSARIGPCIESSTAKMANPADLAKQQQDIQQQLLDARRTMAFEAFRTALDNA